jgi:branched-chain amino acid aminotransferase
MELVTDIAIRKSRQSRISEVDFDQLEFGKYIADHMLVCDYADGEWQTPQIVPYSNLSLSPATLALHYGQTIFEGMKAFRMDDGRINIFRIDKHYRRMLQSLDRMCMAPVPEDIFREGLLKLVEIDEAWVPAKCGDALYIRPFVFASEARFGVKIAEQYRFVIFSGPVPSLYADPVKIKVETEFTRAAKGGTGAAKCGGNYGGSFYPTRKARQEGYDQVLWTDGRENKYIEESGTMNVMFVIGDKLVTPPLSDSILDGVTRDSLLTLAQDMGIVTEERPVSVNELKDAFEKGLVKEVFGAGTAAVVAPVSLVGIGGRDFHVPAYSEQSVSSRLKEQLELIRIGLAPDTHNWNSIL